MKNTIKLSVDELFDLIKQIKDDEMKFVELTILDKEEFDDEDTVKTLSLSAYDNNTYISIDYDMIEEVNQN